MKPSDRPCCECAHFKPNCLDEPPCSGCFATYDKPAFRPKAGSSFETKE